VLSDLWFRRVLLVTAVMNILGAAIFAPPLTAARHLIGVPEPGHPFYGWILALWILFFGLGYLRLAFAKTPERLFVQLGAAGKASFFLLLAAFWLGGDLPILVPLSALPDLLFAILFALWLYQTRRSGQ